QEPAGSGWGLLPPELGLVAETDDDEESAALASADTFHLDEALARGEQWLLAMQNKDGGWGAFDRGADSTNLRHVPLANGTAVTDPSSPDLAGRVLQALGVRGRRLGTPAIDKAVAYLRREQQADGSWSRTFGGDRLHATCQVLQGLRAIGMPAEDPTLQAGAHWLIAHQQPSGGWGESPASRDEPSLRASGNATPSQTAWAVLALIAMDLRDHSAARSGVRFLIDRQNPDGTWDEPEFTAADFTGSLHRRQSPTPCRFSLTALSRWANATES
ncbi:MAG: squalene--hopene cyclase, partial [Planctomycetales bacterium]